MPMGEGKKKKKKKKPSLSSYLNNHEKDIYFLSVF